MIKIKNISINNLKSINLDIPLNKFVCFVGKSGSGKSTLAVNVIYSGYYHKMENIDIDIKPILFHQKVSIPATGETVASYFEAKNNGSIDRSLVLEVFKLLKLDLLDLNQSITSLSLNTYNKVRFIKYLNSIVDEKLLIIDEFGSGLCYEEAMDVVKIYKMLIDNDFSIIAVEHSLPLITNSDYIVELGPDAGIHGGNITFAGYTSEFLKTKNLLTQYLKIAIKKSNPTKNKSLTFRNINYLKYSNLDFKIPLNCLVTVIGESGSGKTSLLRIIEKLTNKSSMAWRDRQDISFENISGKDNIRRPHTVDQTPISSNATSIPLTYIGLMEQVRNCYANNFNISLSSFSFNGNGKCPKCNGRGYLTEKLNSEVVMNDCPACCGKRYKHDILEKKIDDYSIGDLLRKTVEENIINFEKIGINIYKLKFLSDMGLSYLCVGQPSAILSGGECQRIKISKELSKKLGDRSIYILDNPSRGLHVSDIDKLMHMFELLKNKNNSIVVADNNPVVIANSDWIIYVENHSIKYCGEVIDIPVEIRNKFGLETLNYTQN